MNSKTAKVHDLPPFPNGWYVIEKSKNLKKETLVTKRFAGKEVIVFRSATGKVSVSDAYCPHMGAHFGHGGCIKGEHLVCPFHSFEFDENGVCKRTGYGTPPPSDAKLETYTSMERNGLILLYHHEMGQKPEWEVPEMDMEGWTSFLWAEWNLSSHPQETTENSVDIGHFSETHGYRNVHVVSPPIFEENHLRINYGMERVNFISSKAKPVQIEFVGDVYGLGYSIVEARTNLGVSTRHFVLPTPIEDGKIILRIASSVKKVTKGSELHPLASIIPARFLNYVLAKIVIRGYKHDVGQDFKIWENKKYISNAPLAAGDGPILLYRKWAKQFYSQGIE